jgi:hypothetical protein
VSSTASFFGSVLPAFHPETMKASERLDNGFIRAMNYRQLRFVHL